MGKQDEMNDWLRSMIYGLYKVGERKPEIELTMAYVSDKGIYMDNKEPVAFKDEKDAACIRDTIAYEKARRSVGDADCIEKDERQSVAKDILMPALGGALCSLVAPSLLTATGLAVIGSSIIKAVKAVKDTEAQPEAVGEKGPQKEAADFQACCNLIAITLQESHKLENCYVPPYAVLHRQDDEDSMCFCIYQGCGEVGWDAEKNYFLKTILNLFACRMFFADAISDDNRQIWEQLWNDEAIILNAAQQLLQGKCGTGVTINNLGILCAMTYEGKPLQGEIVLGYSLDGLGAVPLGREIEFHAGNLRQICKLMQICQSGYAICVDVGEHEKQGKITALVDSSAAREVKAGVAGRIDFLNGKGWRLYGKEDAILEYRNGRFFFPEDKAAEKNMQDKLEQYFGMSGIWKELVSMVADLNHGAMIIVTTEASKEAERLTGKERGYRVKCQFNRKLFTGFTCIDGALIIDPFGFCEAFGVIVDGKAVATGNVERGSRYNSAKNYIFWKQKTLETEKHKEKYAALVRSDDGNVDMFIMGE